jgi:uncharacterized membrane-anchored protein
MKKISADNPILKKLSINKFVEYLKHSGWMLSKHPNERILLFEGSVDDNGTPLQLILPRSNHFQDANILLAEAINLLAVLKRESPDTIVDSIKENAVGERKARKVGELIDLSENDVAFLEKALDQEPDADDKYNFKGWHKSREGRFFRYLIRVLFLISVIYIVMSFTNFIPNIVQGGLYVTEALVLIIIASNINLFLKFQLTKIDKPALKAASSSTKMFLRFWIGLWVSWISLYSLLAILEFKHLQGKIPFALNAINNLSGVFLFSMYYEMTARTENNPLSKRRVLLISTTVILLFLLLLELSLSKLVPDIHKISSFVSGVIIGVATGLLVTALASRIINLPLWAITVLTLYAVVQLAFPLLVYDPEPWQSILLPFVVVAAFLGKVFLLAIVHWARDTNRLLYYMARTRKIHDEENEQRYAQSFNEAISELEKVVY